MLRHTHVTAAIVFSASTRLRRLSGDTLTQKYAQRPFSDTIFAAASPRRCWRRRGKDAADAGGADALRAAQDGGFEIDGFRLRSPARDKKKNEREWTRMANDDGGQRSDATRSPARSGDRREMPRLRRAAGVAGIQSSASSVADIDLPKLFAQRAAELKMIVTP
jgi:hypothetical protein